jgi:exonuclease SbcC
MKLYINNFRALSNLEVEFTKGINVITGQSGSGKTSIINAFLWCLYGSKKVTNHGSTQNDKPTRIVLSDTLKVNGKDSDILIFRGDKGLEEKLDIGGLDLLTPGFRVYVNGIEKSRPESLIEITYGDFTTFTTTGLLKQKQHSQLLSDNMGSTVTSYIFPEEEDPLITIDRLKALAKELYIKLKVKQGKLDDLKNDTRGLKDKIKAHKGAEDENEDENEDEQTIKNYPKFEYESIEDTHYKDLYVELVAGLNQNKEIEANIELLSQSLVEPDNSKLIIYRDALKKYPKVDPNLDLESKDNLIKLAVAKNLWEEYVSLKKDYSIVEIMDLSEASKIVENLRKTKKLGEEVKKILSIESINIEQAKKLLPEYEEELRLAEESNNRLSNDLAKYKESLSLWKKETSELMAKKGKQEQSKHEYERKILKHQNVLEKYIKYKKDLEEYNENNYAIMMLKNRLDELVPKLHSLEKMLESVELTCPHCDNGVLLMPDKKLIKSSDDDNYSNSDKLTDDYNKTKKKINEVKLKIEKKSTSKPAMVDVPGEEPIAPQYDKIEIPSAPKEPIKSELIKSMPIMHKINYLTNYINNYYTCSDETKKQAIKRISISKDYSKYVSFVEKHGTPDDYSDINIDDLNELVNKYTAETKEYDRQVKKKRETLAQITVLESSLKPNRYPDIIGNVDDKPYELLLDLHNKNIRQMKLDYLYEKKNELKKKIKTLKKENEEIINESTLCEKSINRLKSARAEFIIFTLKSISSNINRLLKELFAEDVQFSISQKKDKLSYEITYGNRGLVRLSAISGGEQDRISIAVTVAFALVCKSPILFFDETLSSLDHDTRNVAYDLLRQELPDKKLIFIMHELNNAAYDNIFNLDNVNE